MWNQPGVHDGEQIILHGSICGSYLILVAAVSGILNKLEALLHGNGRAAFGRFNPRAVTGLATPPPKIRHFPAEGVFKIKTKVVSVAWLWLCKREVRHCGARREAARRCCVSNKSRESDRYIGASRRGSSFRGALRGTSGPLNGETRS